MSEIDEELRDLATVERSLSAFEKAVDQWDAREHGRGRSSGQVADAAPPVFGELPEYFGKLPIDKLTGCWVTCIVDHCVGTDISVGDMARALVVVAERLHKVEFTTPGEHPLSQISTGLPKATAAPKQVGKYTIQSTDAPEAASRKTKLVECIAACMALPATGGWFEWTDAPKIVSSPGLSKKLSEATKMEILAYKSTSGKVIIKRIA